MSNLKRKLVNPSLISLAHQPHLDVTFTGPQYQMHAPSLSENEDGNVPVYPVVNNETGEVAVLISTAVLASTLEKMEGGYVGKRFEIEASAPREGKSYRDVKVWELTEE